MPKKREIYLLFVLVFILVIAVSVSAQEGCFLHSESTLYCSDLDAMEAEEECLFYESCNLRSSFYSGIPCASLPQCGEVLCKSSCDYEFKGQCTAGEVSPEKEGEWCAPGCCQFSFSSQVFCGYKANKWLCEVEAENREAEQFSFNSLAPTECGDVCGSGETMGTELEDVVGEGGLEEADTIEEEKTEISYFKLILGVFILVFLVLLVYYLYKKGFFKKPPIPLPKKVQKITYPKWFSPFLSTPTSKKRLEKIRTKHEHKTRERHRESFLQEIGMLPLKITQTEFTKLQRIIRVHQHKKKYLKRDERKVFQNLEELIGVVAKKREKPSQKDFNPIIEELRKIAGKNK